MIQVVSTAKMSEKHQSALTKSFPQVHFSFVDQLEADRPMLAEAEILVTYGEDLTPEIIDECKSLRWIQVISAGLERMPFEALRRRGILITNARGIHATPMAEYVMAVLLQITRCTDMFMINQKEKKWDRSVRVKELAGSTLGILGAGAIGEGIAKRAKAFDMKTIGLNTDGSSRPYFDEMVSREGLTKVLQAADFLVITLPLTPQTKGWIGKEEIAQMKPSATLINIARGAIVDEEALLYALQSGQIAGAVLDVYEEEPLPASHPFWEQPNLILTPHISGRSPLYMTRALEIFRHNLQTYLEQKGTYINLIDLSKGY